MIAQLSPYYGHNFFSFFAVLVVRVFGFLSGSLSWDDVASDEIQIATLVLISLSASSIGVFLLLRKGAMLANSLSHTILLGIVLAFLLLLPWKEPGGEDSPFNLPILLFAAFLTALLTSFITEFLIQSFGLPPDASTGLVFTTLFALGIILVTLLTRNAHIGTEAIMGNVDALRKQDMLFALFLFTVNGLLVLLLFKEFALSTFDPVFSRSVGFRPAFFSYFLMGQVSLTIVAGFRAVGVLMILAFLTAPILSARLFVKRLWTWICLSMLFGTVASIIGVAFSRHLYSVAGFAVSTGGLVVTLLALQYVICLGWISYRRRRNRTMTTQIPLPSFDEREKIG